jgi:hypothetical protein
MVRISAITLDTLLKLVGGQVIHELGEDCPSGIHPSLSEIFAYGYQSSAYPQLSRGHFQIEKSELPHIAFIFYWICREARF